MIDYLDSNIEKLSVHQVGNKTNEEPLLLSKSTINLSDLDLKDVLLHFFLQSFTVPEYYAFTFSNNDFNLNPLNSFASKIFQNPATFHQNSLNIAKHLYELSIHPQIKSGELFVAYFTDVNLDGEMTEVIGIFKSENKQAFIQPISNKDEIGLKHYTGINVDKIDKGCLIFNFDEETGYKICVIDKGGKSAESQYWKELFLQIRPRNDEYYNTKQVMTIAKSFIAEQMQTEYEVTRPQQIDLLNKSVEYFKNNETYNKEKFENEVFSEPNLIQSFKSFNEKYSKENEIEIAGDFGISLDAVKKQAKIFKSVLKLDKNFHIYIHGNRELIEQGTESNGRKYYKIFYEEES